MTLVVHALALKNIENFHALDNLSEDGVLSVEMWGCDEAEEELGSVGVGSSVSHGEDSAASVLLGEVLVVEAASVDGLTTTAVSTGEVTALSHEAWDDTVELGSLEVEVLALLAHALLSSAEASEVLSGGWGGVSVELHDNSTGSLATNSDVEEDLGVGHLKKCSVFIIIISQRDISICISVNQGNLSA